MQITGLRDGRGRKYLTQAERAAFYQATFNVAQYYAALCRILLFTGCRVSEALRLTPERMDVSECVITFETLKRRKKGIYRGVPVPKELLMRLPVVKAESRFWPISRTTAYRIVKQVMMIAQIKGAHACPKGLRHGFGIACVEQNIPLPTISTWMGHASIKTTSIYLNAVGEEERRLATRLWTQFDLAPMTKSTSVTLETK